MHCDHFVMGCLGHLEILTILNHFAKLFAIFRFGPFSSHQEILTILGHFDKGTEQKYSKRAG